MMGVLPGVSHGPPFASAEPLEALPSTPALLLEELANASLDWPFDGGSWGPDEAGVAALGPTDEGIQACSVFFANSSLSPEVPPHIQQVRPQGQTDEPFAK